MATQKLKSLAYIGTFGISAFITGTYFERKFSPQHNLKNPQDSPIFSTVFAATAVSPVPSETNVGRISQIMKYGFPGLYNVRSFDNFVLSYDKRNRVAHWVFEHITPECCKPNDQVDRALSEFTPDESIHPFFRLSFVLVLKGFKGVFQVFE